MNDQVLERLMMDRALGGLSGDVQELLRSYLATRPDVRDGYSSVVRAARDVMATNQPLTPPPADAIRIVLPGQASRVRWGEAMRLAACALVSCAATIWVVRTAGPVPSDVQFVRQSTPIESPVPARVAAAEQVRTAALPTQRQWVEAQARRAGAAAGGAGAVRVVWHSPVKVPTFGERQ